LHIPTAPSRLLAVSRRGTTLAPRNGVPNVRVPAWLLYGREKAAGELDWKRRLGYRLLGELHIPGRLRTWHVIKELRRLGYWAAAPRTLLDAGGGEGAFAYHAARRFPAWSVTVMDNGPEAVARGHRIKARLVLDNVQVLDADLRELDEPPRYDVIVCADVLEHIEDDAMVVKRLAHALGPGGVLVVTAPSVPQPRHLPLVRWRERRIGFTPAAYGHVRAGYGERELALLLTNAGLEVDRMRFTFGRSGTLMFDLFFATGDAEPYPLVYAALFPLYMALSAIDVAFPHAHGAAILAVGRKCR
jgi:2-polyprenyl-3-methyl-5-hydroxy-6-metoxy-1,4-benzoquinol methylase